MVNAQRKAHFNPLRPCGRRHQLLPHSQRHADFNPLRPCGRRQVTEKFYTTKSGFQSTPPVWAETYSGFAMALIARFQSTPPVWAETGYLTILGMLKGISIHSARVGGDSEGPEFCRCQRNFNPLRPCGRRQQKKPFFRLLSISITTYFTEKSKRTRCKFSHLGYLFQYSLLILVRTSLYVDV